MRLKLEEDYLQNTKNHEEEVQLRLKFESKLNNMHSAHRDLESKYKRVLNDLANAQKQVKLITEKLGDRNSEVTELRTIKAENESIMLQDKEEIASLKREMAIKNRQLKDVEARSHKTADELDASRYKVQESLKAITELRLKLDVHQSTIDGLNSEKKHLMLELEETRDLLKIYEEKSASLNA